MTSSEKVTLLGLFGAAILTAILNIGVREWYAPDIRYAEGGYYISGTTAIISLKLTNYGHSDAEDIIINSFFNKPIVDISTDDQSINLLIISGGKGINSIACKIDRLVPKQELYIYYALNYENITRAELNKHFISKITLKGGMGKTGNPLEMVVLMFTIISLLILSFLIYFIVKEEYKDKLKLYDKIINNINDIIDINHKAKSENITKEMFALQIESYIKDINTDKTYKEQLRKFALRIYNISDNNIL